MPQQESHQVKTKTQTKRIVGLCNMNVFFSLVPNSFSRKEAILINETTFLKLIVYKLMKAPRCLRLMCQTS